VYRGLRHEVAVTGSREDFLSWHGDRLAQGGAVSAMNSAPGLYRALGPRRATSRIRLTASGATGSSVNDRTSVPHAHQIPEIHGGDAASASLVRARDQPRQPTWRLLSCLPESRRRRNITVFAGGQSGYPLGAE
jgi:hypothetical protein